MADLDWFPVEPGRYLKNTLHLTTRQHGAYWLLIFAAFESRGELPGTDAGLMAIAKLDAKAWKEDGETLKAFLTRDGDRWVHEYARHLREDAETRVGKKRQAGKEGGEARWNGRDRRAGVTRSQRLSAARALGQHTKEEWSELQNVLGRVCVRCRISADDLEGGGLCKDHIKPIYQGGDDGIENIQPMCRNCNSQKGPEAKDYRHDVCHDWRKRLAERLAHVRQTPAQEQRQLQRQGSVTPTESVADNARARASQSGRAVLITDDWKPDDELIRQLRIGRPELVGKLFDDRMQDFRLWCREKAAMSHDPAATWLGFMRKTKVQAEPEDWNSRRIRLAKEAIRQ